VRKVAFLVANDKFPEDPSIPSLRFPQNDANDLAEILGDKETCGFETRVYLNKPSQFVLGDFEETSLELTKYDTILFYYSGHGILRGKGLCLASTETKRARLSATSIEAETIFRGGDAENALNALAHSFGSYILTASTAIQKAEEREKDDDTDRYKGNGIFTRLRTHSIHVLMIAARARPDR
jgi:uncharacterized caspase-like protein